MDQKERGIGVPEEDLKHVLHHTVGLWEAVRGRRVFLTGGTGFVGKWLLETLLYANSALALDCHVVVLTRRPEAFVEEVPHLGRHPAVTLIEGDVRNFRYPDVPIDYIVHAATDVADPIKAANYLDIYSVITEGTRHILDLANVSKVAGVLVLSSGAVYGRQPYDLPCVNETYTGAPDSLAVKSAYAMGKRAAEWLASAYASAYGVPCKIARCFAFVGPYLPLDKHFAIGNFMRDGVAGRTIQVAGDGTPLRSYLHAADLAIWLWTLLFRGRIGEAYNVGSDIAISIRHLAEMVASVTGTEGGVNVALRADAGRLPERYIPDIHKARDELGLDVWIGLEDAVLRTLTWHGARS